MAWLKAIVQVRAFEHVGDCGGVVLWEDTYWSSLKAAQDWAQNNDTRDRFRLIQVDDGKTHPDSKRTRRAKLEGRARKTRVK